MIPSWLLPASGKVDIFALHTRLNVPEHQLILHSDTVFVTAVRDPAAQFESLYNFFKFDQFYKMTLEKFATKTIEVNLIIEVLKMIVYICVYVCVCVYDPYKVYKVKTVK